jgi:hypothetical protein
MWANLYTNTASCISIAFPLRQEDTVMMLASNQETGNYKREQHSHSTCNKLSSIGKTSSIGFSNDAG